MASKGRRCQQRVEGTVLNFFEQVYSTLRTSAFTSTRYKAGIYWLVVVAGSFFHDFLPPPNSYLANTRNVFNVYFVKIGWGWTWALLSILVGMTSWVYTSGNFLSMLRHNSRILVATAAWFMWVNFFEYVEHFTGVCKGQSALASKRLCRRSGFFWHGFDISGHCFLLIHCALTISEEIQAVKHLEDKTLTLKGKHWYKILRPFITVAFVCTTLLMLLWEAMLVTTCIYFHTVQQKVLGTLAAMFTWWGTYRYLYQDDMTSVFKLKAPVGQVKL